MIGARASPVGVIFLVATNTRNRGSLRADVGIDAEIGPSSKELMEILLTVLLVLMIPGLLAFLRPERPGRGLDD